MKRSIATVCLSGGLTEKLHACAEAGFDGVEVFEPDLVVAAQSPEEVRALADRLGLTLDLYQRSGTSRAWTRRPWRTTCAVPRPSSR